jgi:hypothetical protein
MTKIHRRCCHRVVVVSSISSCLLSWRRWIHGEKISSSLPFCPSFWISSSFRRRSWSVALFYACVCGDGGVRPHCHYRHHRPTKKNQKTTRWTPRPWLWLWWSLISFLSGMVVRSTSGQMLVWSTVSQVTIANNAYVQDLQEKLGGTVQCRKRSKAYCSFRVCGSGRFAK